MYSDKLRRTIDRDPDDDADGDDPNDEMKPTDFLTKPPLWSAVYLPDSFAIKIKELRDLDTYPGLLIILLLYSECRT
jgi:hypothetical protein